MSAACALATAPNINAASKSLRITNNSRSYTLNLIPIIAR
jgi:hypothetical protein